MTNDCKVDRRIEIANRKYLFSYSSPTYGCVTLVWTELGWKAIGRWTMKKL